MAVTGFQLLIYIAAAAFIIGLIVVAVDFTSDGALGKDGANSFLFFIIIAVVIIIIAFILEKVGAIHKA